jgi:hypothetical protein
MMLSALTFCNVTALIVVLLTPQNVSCLCAYCQVASCFACVRKWRWLKARYESTEKYLVFQICVRAFMFHVVLDFFDSDMFCALSFVHISNTY